MLERLQNGTIERYGLPHDAGGRHNIAGGMQIPPEGDAAILEGAAMARVKIPVFAYSAGG